MKCNQSSGRLLWHSPVTDCGSLQSMIEFFLYLGAYMCFSQLLERGAAHKQVCCLLILGVFPRYSTLVQSGRAAPCYLLGWSRVVFMLTLLLPIWCLQPNPIVPAIPSSTSPWSLLFPYLWNLDFISGKRYLDVPVTPACYLQQDNEL